MKSCCQAPTAIHADPPAWARRSQFGLVDKQYGGGPLRLPSNVQVLQMPLKVSVTAWVAQRRPGLSFLVVATQPPCVSMVWALLSHMGEAAAMGERFPSTEDGAWTLQRAAKSRY